MKRVLQRTFAADGPLAAAAGLGIVSQRRHTPAGSIGASEVIEDVLHLTG